MKTSLTFFFFLKLTFTPSTDTTMLTFFFLMFFTLNSYCKEKTNRDVLIFWWIDIVEASQVFKDGSVHLKSRIWTLQSYRTVSEYRMKCLTHSYMGFKRSGHRVEQRICNIHLNTLHVKCDYYI